MVEPEYLTGIQNTQQPPPQPRNYIRAILIAMDDPLLSSLCSICRTNVPKYTCPRCSVQTCSLPCSRRHKLWSECSGIRDPTAFKPKSQLATPSGIDHDYNFLHSIEHKIERSEKAIVEDRGLVDKGELAAARRDENPADWRAKMRKRKRQNPGQEPIERTLKSMRTTVELAPKGMKRSAENHTTWAKNQKCINWQVEWIREGDAGRSLSRALGNRPIGDVYAEFLEEERKGRLTDEEKRLEKKQKAMEKERLAREAKNDESFVLSASSILQDSHTGAWVSASPQTSALAASGSMSNASKHPNPGSHFYLHLPKTPASFPKVLIPLNPDKSLDKLLRRRMLLEFPTIYVLKAGPHDLPEQDFMLEKDYLSATKQLPWQDSDTEMQDVNESSSEEDTPESETSSSGSDSNSDEDMEDGEIAE